MQDSLIAGPRGYAYEFMAIANMVTSLSLRVIQSYHLTATDRSPSLWMRNIFSKARALAASLETLFRTTRDPGTPSVKDRCNDPKEANDALTA